MQEKSRKHGVGKRLLGLMLSSALVFGMVVPSFANESTDARFAEKAAAGAVGATGQELTDKDYRVGTLNDAKNALGDGGLIGFSGEYALADDSEETTVIVVLKSAPAATQVFEAAVSGLSMTAAEAEQKMASDRDLFIQELNGVLGASQRSRSAGGYTIRSEYSKALNGMAITVPAYAVKAMADFESVYAVFPNEVVTAGPTDVVPVTTDSDISPSLYEEIYGEIANAVDPEGNAAGREHSGADNLHEEGIDGTGVVVAVLDTGVDYNHPAFEGAFMTETEWVAMGGSAEDCIGGFFYGRNYVNEAEYEYLTDPSLTLVDYLENNDIEHDPRDPMETTYERWENTDYLEINPNYGEFYTGHGTHVSGTILSRPVDGHVNNGGSKGIAPAAKLMLYRVLGPYGLGYTVGIIDAIEKTATDGPDVVNMSLGGNGNNGHSLYAYTINNVVIGSAWNMVYVVSAGNSGPNLHTVGTTGVASAAITVANAVEADPLSELVINGSPAASGYGADTEWSITEAGWATNTYSPSDPNGQWNFRMIPFRNTAIMAAEAQANAPLLPYGNGDRETGLGFGAIQEWKALLVEILEIPEAEALVVPANNYVPTAAQIAAFMDSLKSIPALEGVLNGMWIGVNRGSDFEANMNVGEYLGAGGLIMVNRPSAGDAVISMASSGQHIPFLYYSYTNGSMFMDNMIPKQNNKISIKANPKGTVLSGSSSRGPIGLSFEIKPDVAAHGTNVLSTVPTYLAGSETGEYEASYALMSGTSMSAPNITGEVALLKDYNENWDIGEIKARLMNTAENLNEAEHGEKYSVYEQGAGYAHVDLAAETDVIAYATYEYAYDDAVDPTVFTETNTGSLSFGGPDRFAISGETKSNTITVTVQNNTAAAVNYNINDVRNIAGQQTTAVWPDGVELTFSDTSVDVPANGTASFDVTMTIPTDLDYGRYQFEGWVRLTSGTEEIELPYAAIEGATGGAYMQNLSFARSTVTPQEFWTQPGYDDPTSIFTSWETDEFLRTLGAQDYISGDLILGFDQANTNGYIANIALYEADTFDISNLEDSELVGIMCGGLVELIAPSHAILVQGGSRVNTYLEFQGWVSQAVDLNGDPVDVPAPRSGYVQWLVDNSDQTNVPDGDYVVYMELWANNPSGSYFVAQEAALPITVDRTAPVISGTSVTAGVVTGTVEGLGDNGVLFALPNVIKGQDTEEANYGLAEKVTVDENGDFSYSAPAGTTEVELFAIDNYEETPMYGVFTYGNSIYLDYNYAGITDDLYDIEWELNEDGTAFFLGGAVGKAKVAIAAE